jgi:hypothetical protein
MAKRFSPERPNELSIPPYHASAQSIPSPKPRSKAIRPYRSFAERLAQQESSRQLPNANMLASCQDSEAKQRSSSRRMSPQSLNPSPAATVSSRGLTRRNSSIKPSASFKLTSNVNSDADWDDRVLGSLTRLSPSPAKLLKGKDVITANEANDFGCLNFWVLRLILGLAVILFVASASTFGCWATGVSSDIALFVTILAMPPSLCIISFMLAMMSDADSELSI